MLHRLPIYFFLSFFIVASSYAKEQSPWEGKWEYGRYDPALGGALIITDCTKNKCHFDIGTFHGAHTCSVEGSIKINKNKGRYSEKIPFLGNQEILFELNTKKMTINVIGKAGSFCGMRGYLDGIYEHESLPYRYKTSFDCWAETLTPTEKTVCSSQSLSKADLEFDANFKNIKTPEWFKNRNKCKDNQDCIKNFYKDSILKSFSEIKHKKFNLFNYVQSQKQKWYFPTDLLMFNDFFLKSMPEKYYKAWIVSLNDDSYTVDCKDCLAYYYGIAGLYKFYESIVYIDKDQVWLAYVSANLKENEDKNILVFAPHDKQLKDMPPQIKEFTDYLIKSEYYTQNSIKLKHFKDNQSWIDKVLTWFTKK